jgi:hypothetical protein
MKSAVRFLAVFSVAAVCTGCQWDSRQQILGSVNTQAQQRAISTRAFDTGDQAKIFQAAISTLQDLGFVIDRADDILGTISATRYGNGLVRFTVTIRPSGKNQTIVRASGQLNQHELSDPAPFQKFYDAMSQALFLQANAVD